MNVSCSVFAGFRREQWGRRRQRAPQVQVRRVRKSVQVQAPPEGARAHPLRREAVCLPQLRETVLTFRLLLVSHDQQEVPSRQPQGETLLILSATTKERV